MNVKAILIALTISVTACCAAELTSPPQSLELDAFYKKHVDAGGIPVIASERVADAALFRAAEVRQ